MSPTNAGVRLVQMADKHLPATYRWLSESSELRRQIDCLSVPTRNGNLEYWHTKWSDKTREDYAIVNADDEHVGNCGLCDIDTQRRKAQLWIYLGGHYGVGYGTEAVRELLSRAFLELKLNRVYLRVVATNHRADKFYAGLGFVREGVFRQDTILDGKYVDSVLMSLLATEYLPDNPLELEGL